MSRLHAMIGFMISLAVATLAAAQVCTPAFSPPTPEQGPVGAGGTVRALTLWDPDGAGPEQEWLIVGGEGLIPEFSPVDIAAWDGRNWRALNATFSPGVVIRALTTYGGRLFVGGDFTSINGQPASGLAAYDGQTWSVIGPELRIDPGQPASVSAFTVFNAQLYIGGAFNRVGSQQAVSLAVLDGATLVPVPGTNIAGVARIHALTTFSNGVAVGAAAGVGLSPMGLGTATLGLWNGSAWQTLGTTSATGTINDLEVDGATLLVAGATPTGQSGLMRLNTNNSWTSVIPSNQGAVAALQRVAGGVAFASAPTATNVPSMQLLSGTTLTSYQTSNTIAITLGLFRGDLVAGGAFTSIAGRGTRGLAVFINQVWRPVGRGLQAPIIGSPAATPSINAALSDDEYDYYGGNFLGLAAINSGYLARQSRRTGEWVAVPSPDGVVLRLRRLDLDGAGPQPARLYAGLGLASGNFVPSGLRSFDGATWRNEMGPITLPANSSAGVLCIEAFEGDLIAGGNFTQVEAANFRYILRRVNGVWQQMGTAISGITRDLLVHNGVLYAAGAYNGIISGVVRWNGVDWVTTAFPETSAWRLTTYNGRLVASTSLNPNGATASIYELRDGNWFQIGTTDFAEPLTVLDGRLYAGYRVWNGQELVSSVVGANIGPSPPREVILNAQVERVYVGLTAQRHFRTIPQPDARPRFTSPAQSVIACPTSDVTLTVQVLLDPGSQIIWRRNGVPLAPQGAEGVSTDTLTLRRVSPSDAGTYDVIGSGPCGIVTSQPVTLIVDQSQCQPVCGDIDFNNNDVYPEEEDIITFFRVLAGGNCVE